MATQDKDLFVIAKSLESEDNPSEKFKNLSDSGIRKIREISEKQSKLEWIVSYNQFRKNK